MEVAQMLRDRAKLQMQAPGLQAGRPCHLCLSRCQAQAWTLWGSCPCLGSESWNRQLVAGPPPSSSSSSSKGAPPPDSGSLSSASLSPCPQEPVHSQPRPYPLTSQAFVPCALCTMAGAPRAPNSCCGWDAGLQWGQGDWLGPVCEPTHF